MFNKRKVIENYGCFRVIKSKINLKYYVQKKLSKNIFSSRWITICIPHEDVENAKVVALLGEHKLVHREIMKKYRNK